MTITFSMLLMLLMLLTLSVGAVSAAEPANIYSGQKLDRQKGKRIYQAHCARCHDAGRNSAPKVSVPKAWNPSSVKSFSTMEDHAKNGFLGMPAQGRNSPLTDQDMANAVFYILDRIESPK